MKKVFSPLLALSGLAVMLTLMVGSATSSPVTPIKQRLLPPAPSGILQFRDVDFGTGVTECPQAGISSASQPQPLDRRVKDLTERVSFTSSDIRPNYEFSCFPQNETSIAVNPRNPLRNIVAGANDYRLGTGSSGFYASTDGGKNWYSGIIPFPTAPAIAGEALLPSGGDPAVQFDRDGVVYYAQIAFNRRDDSNGIFVARSTNGGFTWSRACSPRDTTPTNPADDAGVCGGVGDARQPGDGAVTLNVDLNGVADGNVVFDDKEYIAVGPRPAGVAPVCFGPFTRTPTACNPAVVGSDRVYVTWTRFDSRDCGDDDAPDPRCNSRILVSYSDDQARSWSAPSEISGSAPFCDFAILGGTECDDNQFSVPTVSPATGALYVGFENFNTPEENQYLVVRSTDGGQTFSAPTFVTPVFDINFPRAGVTRPDCTPRGQQTGRIVYTNSCFRSNAAGNIVVDKRGGAFADDLYAVVADNRNGTIRSSNSDVFIFKSTDGGRSWVGPTRVNDDLSTNPANRECESLFVAARPTCPTGVHTGNDQWWPWVDIGENGELNLIFHDRRLDTASVAHEWGSFSRQRPGNYLVWTFGAQCTVTTADSRECTAADAAVVAQPAAPINPSPTALQDTQGASSPFVNFPVSDIPSNFDYSFRAGIFAGDYNNVAVANGRAHAFWTDARNGRSSGGPAGGPTSALPSEPGRNPICEQSDVFYDSYGAAGGAGAGPGATPNDSLFLVSLCPRDAMDPGFENR